MSGKKFDLDMIDEFFEKKLSDKAKIILIVLLELIVTILAFIYSAGYPL